MDEHIESWFQKLRKAKVAVSGLMLTEEAQKYINLHELKGLALSNGWLYKLLKRLNIVRRKVTKISQKPASLLEEDIKKFVALITEYRYVIFLIFNSDRFDGPYRDSEIANMDEVPLLFDFTPDSTLEYRGSSEVGIRVTNKYKVRATLVLCCLANGFRFPPMLIFKESTGQLPKKLKDAYDEKKIILKANKNG